MMGRTLRITFLVGLALAGFTLPAWAQFRGFRSSPQEYYDSNLQVATSRTATQLFENARRDLESGEIERAVSRIQQILDEHGAAAHIATKARFEGVRDHAHAFLAGLDEKGLAIYRRTFDPYAKELYERGRSERDAEILLDVHRRYEFTAYGRQALLDAMDLELAAGHFHRAVGLALLVGETWPEEVDLRARATAVAAIAAGAAGDPDLLDAALRPLPDPILELEVEIAGTRRPVRSLVDEVRASFTPPTAPAAPSAMSLRRPRWAARLPMRSRGTESAGQLIDFRRTARHRFFSWNPVRPVLDEGTVYLSNGVEIRALGLYGQDEKWVYRGPAKKSQARVNLDADFPLLLHGNVIYGSLEIDVAREQQIWNYTPQMAVPERRLHAIDATTGRLRWSHARYDHAGADGEERFFVSKLCINSRPIVIGDDLFVSATRFHTSYHHYVCCFDRHSGRLRWATFVCTGQMEQNMFGNRIREALSGHLVLHGGELWYTTNIGVVAAVDARLGTLREAMRYQQTGIPRQQRAYRSVFERGPGWANNEPVVVDDRIYFTPLDSSQLIEVDTRTRVARSVLERKEENRYRYILGPVDGRLILMGTRVDYWNVAEGRLEPSRLKLDAGSVTEDRGAGVVGQPLLVGDSLLAPVRYRPRRARSLADRIFVWDLKTRKLVNEIEMELGRTRVPIAGNIAFNGEAVVIAATDPGRNLTFIHGFFDEAELLARLRRRMAAQPRDPEPHFQFGEILVQSQSEDVSAIISAFERSKSLARKKGPSAVTWAEKSREALYRLYVQLATDAPDRRRAVGLADVKDCYEKALANAGDEGQSVDVLFLLAAQAVTKRDRAGFEKAHARIIGSFADAPYDHQEVLSELPGITVLESYQRYERAGLPATVVAGRFEERLGRPQAAISFYQTLIRDYAGEPLGSDTAWRWARDRIGALITKHGDAVYATEESRASALYQAGLGADGLGSLRRLLELYPNSSFAPRAHLEVARRQIAAGRADEAVSSIAASLARVDRPSGELLVSLARALESLGLSESARQAWNYAAARAPRDIVADGEARPSVSELASAALARLGPAAKVDASRPELGFAPKEVWARGRADQRDDWILIEPGGRSPENFANRFLAFRGGKLHAFDLDDREPRWSLECDAAPYDDLFWQDGRLVGRLDNQYVVLDPESGEEHWRAGVDGRQLAAIAVGQGRVYGIVQPHSLASKFRLQARSIGDGTLIYDLAFDGVPPSEISVGDRWLVVALETEPLAWVLDPFTGARAPGFPDGLRYEEFLAPFMAAGDLVVAVPEASRSEARRLCGFDPETGQARWTRQLGRESVRFWNRDRDRVFYRLRNRETDRSTLVVADLRDGSNLLQRTLEPEVMLLNGSLVLEDRLYAVLSRPVRKGSSLRARYVEAIGFAKGEPLWRSADFARNQLVLYSFEKGLLINVLERVRTSGRSTRKKTTINLLDAEQGRARQAIKPASGQGSQFREMVLIRGGKLVLAEGPILKVYE